MAELRVREVAPADLLDVARLHRQAFPDSVLSELGEEAVRRSYRWQMEGPHDLTAIVAVEGDITRGFLFGGVFRGSTIGFVKSERWFLVRRVAANPKVLMRGVGWNRVLLGLRLLARRAAPDQAEDPEGVPRRSLGVLAIAVDPRFQGHGVGRALMADVAGRAIVQGFESMHLTVHPSNDQAVGFYKGLGWSPVPEVDGVWRGRMRFDLTGAC